MVSFENLYNLEKITLEETYGREEKKGSNIETTTLEKVPMEERKNWIDVALIQAGIMILCTKPAAWRHSGRKHVTDKCHSFWCCWLLNCHRAVLSDGHHGKRSGCAYLRNGYRRLWQKGARFIISTLIFISMIGWFAVQTSVCGDAFSNLIDQFFHISVSPVISMVIWGLIMLVTAVYGINALDKLNKVAVPALFIVTIVGCIMALNKYGTQQLSVNPAVPSMSFIDGIVLTVSFMAAGCLAASDITRYQRTRKDTIISSSLGVAPAGVLMVVLGAIMTRVAQQYDITLVFCEIGIPILGMLVLISATWTTNTTNAYSGGINAVLMFNLAENKESGSDYGRWTHRHCLRGVRPGRSF